MCLKYSHLFKLIRPVKLVWGLVRANVRCSLPSRQTLYCNTLFFFASLEITQIPQRNALQEPRRTNRHTIQQKER